MITLPPGFDVALLVSDFADMVLPFVPIFVLITAGSIIFRILKNAI